MREAKCKSHSLNYDRYFDSRISSSESETEDFCFSDHSWSPGRLWGQGSWKSGTKMSIYLDTCLIEKCEWSSTCVLTKSRPNSSFSKLVLNVWVIMWIRLQVCWKILKHKQKFFIGTLKTWLFCPKMLNKTFNNIFIVISINLIFT